MPFEPERWSRVTLVALDGSKAPAAAAQLRAMGFEGELTGISYSEWMPVLYGLCDSVQFVMPSKAPLMARLPSLAWALMKTDLWADALIWCGGSSRLTRRLLQRLSICPVYTFYNGKLDALDPARETGAPHPDPGGQEEAKTAIGYLAPALDCADAKPGALCVVADGDGIAGYEATGVQWYKRHLFAAYCEPSSEVDLRVLSRAGAAHSPWELPWHRRMIAEPPAARIGAALPRERAVPVRALCPAVDVYHLTFFERPPYRHARMAATVYDVMPLALPEAFPARFVERLERAAPVWQEECQRLICISEATRDDLARLLNIPKERSVCIPPGKHPHFHPRGAGPVDAVRRKYALDAPYFLAVGSIAPHKNIETLARAFKHAKDRAGFPHVLALAGRPAWLADRVFHAIERMAWDGDIVFTGYVPWLELPALYAGATAFCMPSLYEGYGLPAQEAMCCGCPVLLSNAASLPEVGGDAAVYVDPRDELAFAGAIERTATDKAFRAERKQAALHRAETFPTWQSVAAQHAEVYRAMLQEG